MFLQAGLCCAAGGKCSLEPRARGRKSVPAGAERATKLCPIVFSFQIFLLLQTLCVARETNLINPRLVEEMTTKRFIEAFLIGISYCGYWYSRYNYTSQQISSPLDGANWPTMAIKDADREMRRHKAAKCQTPAFCCLASRGHQKWLQKVEKLSIEENEKFVLLKSKYTFHWT